MQQGVIPTPMLLTVREREQLKELGGSYIGGVRKLLVGNDCQQRYTLMMAFGFGEQARKDRQAVEMNPYPADSAEALSWIQGWERRDRDEQRNAALQLVANYLDALEANDLFCPSCGQWAGEHIEDCALAQVRARLRELGYEAVNSEPNSAQRVLFDVALLPET